MMLSVKIFHHNSVTFSIISAIMKMVRWLFNGLLKDNKCSAELSEGLRDLFRFRKYKSVTET